MCKYSLARAILYELTLNRLTIVLACIGINIEKELHL